MEGSGPHGGFLPPEPPGPEPELERRQPPAPPPPPAPPQQVQAPTQGQPPQYPTPQEQLGWTAPPGAIAPTAARNSQAITGFVLSTVSGSLLVLSVGISSLLTVGMSIAGIVVSRRGLERIERGETRQHRELARAGVWTGIAGVVLGTLATVAWALLLTV